MCFCFLIICVCVCVCMRACMRVCVLYKSYTISQLVVSLLVVERSRPCILQQKPHKGGWIEVHMYVCAVHIHIHVQYIYMYIQYVDCVFKMDRVNTCIHILHS